MVKNATAGANVDSPGDALLKYAEELSGATADGTVGMLRATRDTAARFMALSKLEKMVNENQILSMRSLEAIEELATSTNKVENISANRILDTYLQKIHLNHGATVADQLNAFEFALKDEGKVAVLLRVREILTYERVSLSPETEKKLRIIRRSNESSNQVSKLARTILLTDRRNKSAGKNALLAHLAITSPDPTMQAANLRRLAGNASSGSPFLQSTVELVTRQARDDKAFAHPAKAILDGLTRHDSVLRDRRPRTQPPQKARL
ncbi:MAG: hypothetical protein NT157_03445 [Candidatus Micrarchaeota archaeon]|nr:hypothetical protein [Candidatus Micrarchaeota archaeon]